MGRLVRRADTGHRCHRLTLVRGSDDGRAPKGMPDEQAYVAARSVHELHRADCIGDLVRERPVAPVALGVAQAEVVEAEHADALTCELLTDPARSRAVLAQCEAVGEDTPSPDLAPSADLALGEIDETCQGGSGGAGEPDALGHGVILSPADSSSKGVAIDRKLVDGRRKSALGVRTPFRPRAAAGRAAAGAAANRPTGWRPKTLCRCVIRPAGRPEQAPR